MRALKRIGLLSLLLACFGLNAFGQARIMLRNNAYIVIDNAAQLVIDNPNGNAINVNPSGGNIVSEDEDDLIKWNIGPTTGNYIIPWTNANNVKIPLEVFVTTAGTGNGHLLLSTHSDNDAINNWNNFDYRPSDVTNMGGPGIPNNSANVIDRFWRIEHTAYTTPPQAMINFGYDDAERTNPGNTIPPGSMFAQEFDAAQGWQGAWYIPGTGTDTWPSTYVVGANAVAHPFFKSWTLSVVTVPLPVGSLVFEAERSGENVLLEWEVADLENVEVFVVERGLDSLIFSEMGQEPALPGLLRYQVVDELPFAGMNHYRLRIVDRNGAIQYSDIKTVLFENQSVNVFPNPLEGGRLNVQIEGMAAEEVKIRLVDVIGRVLLSENVHLKSDQELVPLEFGENRASGVYVVEVRTEKGALHRQKVIVR